MDTTVEAVNGTALSWIDVQSAALGLATRARRRGLPRSVYGVPTGGAPVAVLVAGLLRVDLADEPGPDVLVVDDLIDTGRTLRPYFEQGLVVDALYRKPWSPHDLAPDAEQRDTWLRFPWERAEGAPVDAVIRLLQYIGEDPTREGLAATPGRVIKALQELTRGYRDDVASILSTDFGVAHSGEIVLSTRLPFVSMCEHHLLPFEGVATIGYVPNGRVVGLSKLARLLDALACRLQVQEQLTVQLTDAMTAHLHAQGAAVIIEGRHTCQAHRGVRKDGRMITSSFVGACDTDRMRTDVAAAHRAWNQ